MSFIYFLDNRKIYNMLNDLTKTIRGMEKEELSKYIFQYSLDHLPQKDKVRFFYALKGRGNRSGIISNNIEQLGKGVILTDNNDVLTVDSFLNSWNCKFKKRCL